MALSVRPLKTREFIPIYVDVDVKGHDKPHRIEVREITQGHPFFVPLRKDAKSEKLSGNFWLEKAGEYTITYGSEVARVTVEPQIFMGLSRELGLSMGLLALVLAGVLIWIRRIRQSST
jgi:hypothetical protein